MDYKLIAFDMDDTLLDSHGELSEANHQALDELMARGIQVVLCSGRPTPSLLRSARKLLGDKPGEYIISFNGAAVCDVHSGKELIRTPLPSNAGLKILETARTYNVLLQAYQGDNFYVEKEDPRVAKYSNAIGIPSTLVSDLSSIIFEGSLKLLMNGPREILDRAYTTLKPRAEAGEFAMVFSKPEYLEFIHPQVNKGAGLQALCKLLGIPIEATIGVGDSYNDIEMLETAGLGIAVANAKDQVKAKAKMVLESNHDQSIVLEIKDKVFQF